MHLFSEKEIREVVGLNEKALSLIEEGFERLAEGAVSQPQVARVDLADKNGEVDIKTAYIRGLETFAIKISSGFFDNEKYGLPSLGGMMMLLSTETGVPQALMHDNGYLTDVRTGIAGALAAKYMAPASVNTCGVIGTGAQARFQVEALRLARGFDRVLVYGRTPEKVETYKKEMEEKLDVPVEAASSPEEVVKESEVVITTTPSKEAIIKKEWLHPKLHITAMGSDAEHKQELDPNIFQAADIVACDVYSQAVEMGELHHAKQAQMIKDPKQILEMGPLVKGEVSGRTSDQQITVCDLTGTGVQDTAISVYAYQTLKANGKGQEYQS
ncbi:cyclodeaminase [Salsuginibacillus kocurii]|uniref:cyclodeaminase n=1 Tax=Salsuginibacillus kocurii TaxID=427078 RepID=UPI0003781067|nr:cyclodeaminase [Salsuginibacillus kocurii]